MSARQTSNSAASPGPQHLAALGVRAGGAGPRRWRRRCARRRGAQATRSGSSTETSTGVTSTRRSSTAASRITTGRALRRVHRGSASRRIVTGAPATAAGQHRPGVRACGRQPGDRLPLAAPDRAADSTAAGNTPSSARSSTSSTFARAGERSIASGFSAGSKARRGRPERRKPLRPPAARSSAAAGSPRGMGGSAPDRPSSRPSAADRRAGTRASRVSSVPPRPVKVRSSRTRSACSGSSGIWLSARISTVSNGRTARASREVAAPVVLGRQRRRQRGELPAQPGCAGPRPAAGRAATRPSRCRAPRRARSEMLSSPSCLTKRRRQRAPRRLAGERLAAGIAPAPVALEAQQSGRAATGTPPRSPRPSPLVAEVRRSWW